ncbi:MAG TPA: RpiB/LacA/LacB family sugar-phosphate isomerase [Candidatus Limnocylindrales bacterium]|nr:RpiB/LacA/LacB family sugar-phosphate isomerase [Candidatus Limnocylindrales bacterium]
MRLAFAADHAGAALKDELLDRLDLLDTGHDLIDLGGDGSDPTDDYPDFADRLGSAIREGIADRGVLICGSGVGASVAANKLPGIRAAVCHDTYSAHQGVEHDDMNVLTLGARVIGSEAAIECCLAFLGARFSGEARHRRRLAKVLEMEARGVAEAARLGESGRSTGPAAASGAGSDTARRPSGVTNAP